MTYSSGRLDCILPTRSEQVRFRLRFQGTKPRRSLWLHQPLASQEDDRYKGLRSIARCILSRFQPRTIGLAASECRCDWQLHRSSILALLALRQLYPLLSLIRSLLGSPLQTVQNNQRALDRSKDPHPRIEPPPLTSPLLLVSLAKTKHLIDHGSEHPGPQSPLFRFSATAGHLHFSTTPLISLRYLWRSLGVLETEQWLLQRLHQHRGMDFQIDLVHFSRSRFLARLHRLRLPQQCLLRSALSSYQCSKSSSSRYRPQL